MVVLLVALLVPLALVIGLALATKAPEEEAAPSRKYAIPAEDSLTGPLPVVRLP